MDGLRERELQGLLEILCEVHHADDVPAFRAALLDVMPRVIPNACTSYNEIAADGTPLVTIVTPTPPQRQSESWARYGHQLVVTRPAPPRLLIGLALADERDFTDGERRVLDLARPHLIQAHANAALRERLRDVLVAVEAGLDDSGEAIVVVDVDGRVDFATAAGRAALDALGPPGGHRLPDALRDVTAEACPSRAVVPVPGGGEPLVVRRTTRTPGQATVLVFERGARGASRELLEALGLSPREAEVLQAMMRGRGTVAIAAELGVSPRTVSKHAERIYDKLGVHDRVAAISAAWAALDSGRAHVASG